MIRQVNAIAFILVLIAGLGWQANAWAQTRARQVCAIIIDWEDNRSRVLDVLEALENNDVPAAYLLFGAAGEDDAVDARAAADLVFSTRPALVVVHLSSFYELTHRRDNDLFGQFFGLVETAGETATPPYRPHYVVYTRADIDKGNIARWSDREEDTFADRLDLVLLTQIASPLHTKTIEERAVAQGQAVAATCPDAANK